jgi:hypothetical protein
MLHYRDEANRDLIEEGLLAVGRTDLIGRGEKCLIRASSKDARKREKKGAGNEKKSSKS